MVIGKNVDLREFRREDIEKYVKLTSRHGNSKKHFTGMLLKISDIYQQYEGNGLLTKDGGRLLITSKEDDILGYVSYFKGSPYMNGYEIGYQIFEEQYRGRGFGTEAVRLMTDFLFDYQPILRIQICMSEENHHSERVAVKAGFAFEGIMRSVFKSRDKIVNNKIYSITREEWSDRGKINY